MSTSTGSIFNPYTDRIDRPSGRRKLVIIDPTVSDYQSLLPGISSNKAPLTNTIGSGDSLAPLTNTIDQKAPLTKGGWGDSLAPLTNTIDQKAPLTKGGWGDSMNNIARRFNLGIPHIYI